VDLFFSRPFLKARQALGAIEWAPSLLILRDDRLSLFNDYGQVFDVEARQVTAHFSRWVTMTLTVDGNDFAFSNLPTATSPAISPHLGAQAQAIRDEQMRLLATRRLPKDLRGSLANWRTKLLASGATVLGTRGWSESILTTISLVAAIAVLTIAAALIMTMVISR
jgi:hypothetical protein